VKKKNTKEETGTSTEEIRKPVDPRNTLNDLNGKEWLPETKSFVYQKGLGAKHPHAQIERQHPAPFSYQDIEKLIKFFTKQGQTVLDPFSGVGSTIKACALNERKGIGIELSEHWNELAKERINIEVKEGEANKHIFINEDCRLALKTMETNSIDFVVTSPPYWSILNKKADHKTKNRVEDNLKTNYSEDPRDLGNIDNYEEFLSILVDDVIAELGRVLKEKKYLCLIVSDFRHKSEYVSFHSDLIQRVNKLECGDHKLSIQGVKVLLQNHKPLLPYGYPFAYVENIHHQYILIFRKI
jgi:DNA modification methylase